MNPICQRNPSVSSRVLIPKKQMRPKWFFRICIDNICLYVWPIKCWELLLRLWGTGIWCNFKYKIWYTCDIMPLLKIAHHFDARRRLVVFGTSAPLPPWQVLGRERWFIQAYLKGKKNIYKLRQLVWNPHSSKAVRRVTTIQQPSSHVPMPLLAWYPMAKSLLGSCPPGHGQPWRKMFIYPGNTHF